MPRLSRAVLRSSSHGLGRCCSRPLIDLHSVDCSLEVRVLGRDGPGVPGPHDDLDVELTAAAGPFAMSVTDVLLRDELADWAACLDRLASGEAAIWRDSGRTLLGREHRDLLRMIEKRFPAESVETCPGVWPGRASCERPQRSGAQDEYVRAHLVPCHHGV